MLPPFTPNPQEEGPRGKLAEIGVEFLDKYAWGRAPRHRNDFLENKQNRSKSSTDRSSARPETSNRETG